MSCKKGAEVGGENDVGYVEACKEYAHIFRFLVWKFTLSVENSTFSVENENKSKLCGWDARLRCLIWFTSYSVGNCVYGVDVYLYLPA